MVTHLIDLFLLSTKLLTTVLTEFPDIRSTQAPLMYYMRRTGLTHALQLIIFAKAKNSTLELHLHVF